MARPHKETVDYFPHMVKHGKSMLAIESRFGNDGYAFWFKLLEMLGETEGHVFDCNNPVNIEYLLAKTHVSEVAAFEILDLLVKIGSIDAELWEEKKIWCQHFLDGVADVYKRRKMPKPQKPSLCKRKPSANELMLVETPQNDVVDDINPQSKVKESKGEESKGEESSSGPPAADPIENNYVTFFNNNIHPMTPFELQVLSEYQELGDEVIMAAMGEAVKAGVRRLSYIEAILRDWKAKGIIDMAGVEAAKRDKADAKKSSSLKQETGLEYLQRIANGGKNE
jgi:DnaD/phage-associated family protein